MVKKINTKNIQADNKQNKVLKNKGICCKKRKLDWWLIDFSEIPFFVFCYYNKKSIIKK